MVVCFCDRIKKLLDIVKIVRNKVKIVRYKSELRDINSQLQFGFPIARIKLTGLRGNLEVYNLQLRDKNLRF